MNVWLHKKCSTYFSLNTSSRHSQPITISTEDQTATNCGGHQAQNQPITNSSMVCQGNARDSPSQVRNSHRLFLTARKDSRGSCGQRIRKFLLGNQKATFKEAKGLIQRMMVLYVCMCVYLWGLGLPEFWLELCLGFAELLSWQWFSGVVPPPFSMSGMTPR